MKERFKINLLVGRKKSKFFTISFKMILSIFIFFYLFNIFYKKNNQVKAQSQTTVVVCPSGTAGQNGCNYVGSTGIQQAIDQIPNGTNSNPNEVFIKDGTYTNVGIQIGIAGHPVKSNIKIRGESLATILDGLQLGDVFHISGSSKGIIITNLTIKNAKFYGIALENDSQVIITNNQITNNQYSGICLGGSSQATITNNHITNNQNSGIYLRDVFQATIVNNTIAYNKVMGIDIYQCADRNPSVTAKNNIITTNNSFGIGGSCLHESNKLENDSFSYNLIWGNAGENTSCGRDELCENFTGRINADPQFVDPQNGDFRFKSTSPAIDAGDPEIKDKDGSRSDMGSWGGPDAAFQSPSCQKTLGDANCDGSINDADYNIWRCEFLGNGLCSNPSSNLFANFNLDQKVDLIDFEIWRKNNFKPTIK